MPVLRRSRAINPFCESLEYDFRYFGGYFISFSIFKQIKKEMKNINYTNDNIIYIIDYFLSKWNKKCVQPSIYNINNNNIIGYRPHRYCWCLMLKISKDIKEYKKKHNIDSDNDFYNDNDNHNDSHLEELNKIKFVLTCYKDNTIPNQLVQKYIQSHNDIKNPNKKMNGLFKLCECNDINSEHQYEYHYPHHYDCEHGRYY
jgi:hypothetical protein